MGPLWRERLRKYVVRMLRTLGLAVARLRPGALVVVRSRGVRLRRLAPGAVLVVRSDLARGHWPDLEKSLTSYAVHEHVAAMLRMYRVNCVLDVGANRGQYARSLRRAGYGGHIASFEPVPDVYEQLRERAAADPAWTAYPYALGREDGVTEMNVVPGTLSSLLEPSLYGRRRYVQLREPTAVEVPVRRLEGLLDTVLADVPRPRPYLKLDTQGYDLEVFAGLGERVREFVGMQAELALLRVYEGMPRLPEALEAYEEAGFRVTGLFPVSRRSRTAQVVEFDCVMVRPDAL